MKKGLLLLILVFLFVGCKDAPAIDDPVMPTIFVAQEENVLTEDATPTVQDDTGTPCTMNKECDSYYCHFENMSNGEGVCGFPSMMEERLEGNGDTPQAVQTIIIQNEESITFDGILNVSVAYDGFVMTMGDIRSERQYTTEYLDDFHDPDVTYQNGRAELVYHFEDMPDITIMVEVDADSVYLTLDMPVDAPFEELVFPGAIATEKGEWLVLPRASGAIIPVDEVDLWGFSFFSWKSSMNFIGVLEPGLETGLMMRMEEDWSSEVYFHHHGEGKPIKPYPIHLAEKGVFGQSRHITYTLISSGGYVTMAEKQHGYALRRGYIKTLDEKIQENPNVEKLIGAVDLWLGCGHQEMIETMSDYGFDHALINFYYSFTTPDDVCEEEITLANQLGYLTGRYDIYTDVWDPDDTPGEWMRSSGYPEDVIVKADGEFQEGWVHKEEGLFGKEYQGYYTSSATHVDVARPTIETDLAQNSYLARFIDVELATSLFEDYSAVHPATRQDDMYYRMQMLDMVKNRFDLITGSEEFHEWAVPFHDYSEGTMTMLPEDNAGYDWITPINKVSDDYINFNISPFYRIPLQQLVYHDSHVATWYTGDGATKVPDHWADKDLFNALYGSMPLFMPPDEDYWWDHLVDFVDSYHIAGLVFRETGTARMIDHRVLTDDRLVQETEFDNGWVVTANFREEPFVDERYPYPLAVKGMYATNGENVVAKLEMGGGATIYVQLLDRIYLHPQAGGVEYGGFRTSDAILLQWEEAGNYQLTLLNGQRRVQLNTIDIPMKLSIGQFKDEVGNIITFKDLGDGWIELMIPANTTIVHWYDD